MNIIELSDRIYRYHSFDVCDGGYLRLCPRCERDGLMNADLGAAASAFGNVLL